MNDAPTFTLPDVDLSQQQAPQTQAPTAPAAPSLDPSMFGAPAAGAAADTNDGTLGGLTFGALPPATPADSAAPGAPDPQGGAAPGVDQGTPTMTASRNSGIDPSRTEAILAAIQGASSGATTTATPQSPAAPQTSALPPEITTMLATQNQAITAMLARMDQGSEKNDDATTQALAELIPTPEPLDPNVANRFQNNADLQRLIEHTAQTRAAEMLRPITERLDQERAARMQEQEQMTQTLAEMRSTVYNTTLNASANDMQELRSPEAAGILDAADPLTGQTPRQLLAAAHSANDAAAVQRITGAVANRIRDARAAATGKTPTSGGPSRDSGAAPATPSSASPQEATQRYEQQKQRLDQLYAAKKITQAEYMDLSGRLMATLMSGG